MKSKSFIVGIRKINKYLRIIPFMDILDIRIITDKDDPNSIAETISDGYIYIGFPYSELPNVTKQMNWGFLKGPASVISHLTMYVILKIEKLSQHFTTIDLSKRIVFDVVF